MTITKTKPYYLAGLIAVALVVVGIGAAKALNEPSWFWERVAERTAQGLVDKTETPSFVPGPAVDPSFGVAGDTYVTDKIASVIVSTSTLVNVEQVNSASTTLGMTLNPTRDNGGRMRYVTESYIMLLNTAGTYLGGALTGSMGTSTSAVATSTAPIFTATITTTTEPMFLVNNMVSTTLPATNRWKQLWQPGEYFGCATNRVVSTTGGVCVTKYFIAD